MMNANDFNFLPGNPADVNRAAMQKLLDQGGTIRVDAPGVYDIDGSLLIDSNTTLEFANGTALRKIAPEGKPFTFALINRGAFTKTWNEHIVVRGLKLLVNGVDLAGNTPIKGLRGQIAFHYIRDLRLEGIRIPDLEAGQFAIHICTFEDIYVGDCIIVGKKDGVHLGRGRRFTVTNCVFDTFDDAVALNAHDYDSSNPELGMIEDGIIEKCWDVNPSNAVGYFCRILAGAWVDWYPGMEVQKSDTVVSNGRLYRRFASPDDPVLLSMTRPEFPSGTMELDGILWAMVQEDVTYTAGVKNVTFRDIWLEKPRTSFSVHFDHDKWSRSFYPGAKKPEQANLVFDGIRVQHNSPNAFLSAVTPIDSVTVTNSSLGSHKITFANPAKIEDLGPTKLTFLGCHSDRPISELVENRVEGKRIDLTVV